MKVYLVWSGDYEQRGISRIFSTMAAAEAYTAGSGHPSEYDIEEAEVQVDPPEWLTVYEATWNTLLGEHISSFHATADILGIKEAEEETKRGLYYGVTVYARTRQEAVARMHILRSTWLERQGLTEVPKPDHPMPSAWYSGMTERYGV